MRAKNSQETVLIEDFFKLFDSIHRVKMEQILHGCGFPKETVTAIRMLYKTWTQWFAHSIVTLISLTLWLESVKKNISIIEGFWTIAFIVIATTFQPILFVVACRAREYTRNFERRPLLNPQGSPVLIPLAITGKYSCFVTLVRIEPTTIRWLSHYGTNAYYRYAMCPAGRFRENFWEL